MSIYIWEDLVNLEYTYNFVGKTHNQLVTDGWTSQAGAGYAAFGSYGLYCNINGTGSTSYSRAFDGDFSKVKKITLKLYARVYGNKGYYLRLVKSVSGGSMVNVKTLYNEYTGRGFSIKSPNLVSTPATTSQVEDTITLDLENKTRSYSATGGTGTLTDTQIADIRDTGAFCIEAFNNAGTGSSSGLTSIYVKIES